MTAVRRSVSREDEMKRIGGRFVAQMIVTTAIAVAGLAAGPFVYGDAAAQSVNRIVVPTNNSPWLVAYRKLVAEYEKETGIQVELRAFPLDELRTILINDIQSGSATYDVYQVDEPFIAEFNTNKWLKPFNTVDSAWAADPHVYGYDGLSYWNFETGTSDAKSGVVIGQPLNGNVQLLMYRKDIYDKLGLAAPKIWADVVANGKAAMDAKAIKYGYVVRAQASTSGAAQITTDFMPIFYSFGGDWFADAGVDWTPTVNTPAGVSAAQTLRDLVALGPADTATIGMSQAISAMQAGDALQTQLVAAASGGLLNPSKSTIADTVGFGALPSGTAGGKPGVATGVFTLGIPSNINDERAKAALAFITWVSSKKSQIVFAEGGGIPTRDDVVSEANLSEGAKAYLSAVQELAPNAKSYLRIPISSKIFPITDKYLSQIAAGTISAEVGMNAMQEELVALMKAEGYALKGQ